jgi:hypothetical protein
MAPSLMSLPSSKNVVASAAESEVGACFHNAQSGAPLRVTLTELGHIKPPKPLRTDNSTEFGILNETIKQKRLKAMDLRYHWLTDRVRQKQFDIYWRPGRENLADYHTTSQRYARINITSGRQTSGYARVCLTTLAPATPAARAHIRTYKSKSPESHPTKECARTHVLCLKIEP